MKRILLLLFVAVVVSSCIKKNDTVTPVYNAGKQYTIDSANIVTYLAAHPEITPVKDSLGVKYQVITAGTGAYPTLNSTIQVNYSGSLLNGTVFDSGTGYVNVLGNLIGGWRIVLPHVRYGSKVLMIIPSYYGYQDGVSSKIPANSVLVFTVDLLSGN